MDSSEDDLIDDIMLKLKDEDTICIKEPPHKNEKCNTTPPGSPFLFYELIESAEVVIEDGIDLNELSTQNISVGLFNESSSSQQPEHNETSTTPKDRSEVMDWNNASIFENNVVVNEPSLVELQHNEPTLSATTHEDQSYENLDLSNLDDPDDPDYIFPEEDPMSNSDDEGAIDNAATNNVNNGNNSNSTSSLNNSENSLSAEVDFAVNENHNGEDREVIEVGKRKRNKKAVPETWEVNKNKFLRMTGKEYIGFNRKKLGDKMVVTKGDKRKERTVGPRCNSKVCNANKKRRCTEFSEDDRATLFKEFWKLSWKEKEIYVRSNVSRTKPKRRTGKSPSDSRRLGTLSYYLKQEGVSKPVCKKFFLNTLGVKEWMTHNWIKKDSATAVVEEDEETEDVINDVNNCQEVRKQTRRGKKSPKEKHIHEWLDQLPKVPSHYCRKSSNKLYLEPVWESKRAMYEQYKNNMNVQGKPAGSLTMFMNIFELKNLSIYTPKKDQCDTCCAFKVGNIPIEEYEKHIAEKIDARDIKDADKKLAEKGDIYCLTADVESVKLTPMTKASAMYYKTKLCSHNYTVYNLANRHTTCYWFNECEGDLTANTFASCLTDYITKHCLDPKRPIVIYSDGCTNQNRNQILSNALLLYSVQNKVEITQKYLIKGHTQMEGDFVHAKIEEKLKGKEVFVPYEYVKYTKEAREKPFPYVAEYLTHDFFKDYTAVQYYDSIRPGKVKGDPTVIDIRCLKYNPGGTIQYKLNFSDAYRDLPRRPSKPKTTQPPQLLKSQIPLPESKWKHLQELKTVIPKDYHDFYDKLPYVAAKKA